MSVKTLSLAHGANVLANRDRMVTLSEQGAAWRNSNGTFRGEPGGATQTGQLPEEFAEEAHAAAYVIYSYATPIAWRDRSGRWVFPCVSYSRTTARHQSLANRITW